MSKKLGGVTDCDAGDTCSRTPQISRRAAQTHPRRFYFVWTSKTGVCLINLQRALVNNLWWLSLWRKASRPRTIDVKTVRLTATHSHGELEFFLGQICDVFRAVFRRAKNSLGAGFAPLHQWLFRGGWEVCKPSLFHFDYFHMVVLSAWRHQRHMRHGRWS